MVSERRLLDLGRFVFAIAICGFGAQYLLYGHFARGLVPGQAWTPSMPPLAYLLGFVFVATGISLLRPRSARRAALAIGVILIAGAVIVNFAHLADVSAHGDIRTGAFETLAIGSAALGLASVLSTDRRTRALGQLGRYLFAFSLCVFGLQHFLSAPYIATLIPSWMPAHLALTYASGIGFIAAGVAIGANVQARLGASLLGLMFLVWVATLHVPLVVAQPHNGDLWTSLFVAIAMCGAGFIFAGAPVAAEKRSLP